MIGKEKSFSWQGSISGPLIQVWRWHSDIVIQLLLSLQSFPSLLLFFFSLSLIFPFIHSSSLAGWFLSSFWGISSCKIDLSLSSADVGSFSPYVPMQKARATDFYNRRRRTVSPELAEFLTWKKNRSS